MDRNEKFGRLLSICNILGARLFEEGKPPISEKLWRKFPREPRSVIEKLHENIMQYAHKFGETEVDLLDMFSELMAKLDASEFNDNPLDPVYLLGYYKQGHAINNVMGVEEAAELWNLAPGTIKNYCAEGKVIARKIGKTWIIDKNQPNPSQGGEAHAKEDM